MLPNLPPWHSVVTAQHQDLLGAQHGAAKDLIELFHEDDRTYNYNENTLTIWVFGGYC